MPRKKKEETVMPKETESKKTDSAATKPKAAKKSTAKKTESERREEILQKRNGVASSNAKLPDGMKVKVPMSPSFTGRKFRPNLKSLDPNGVIFIEGSDKYKEEASPEQIAYQRLKNSIDPNVQSIFTGTIVGKRDIVSEKGTTVSYALVWTNAGVEGFKGRTIMISYSDLFIPNGTKASAVVAPGKYIDSLLGAEIDFTILDMITDANGQEKYIIGSRKRASLRKIATYWESKQDGKFLLDAESIVEARIVTVAPRGIRVEIFGMEFFIPGKELSYGAISNCCEHFSVGTKLKVKLLSVERKANGDIFADLSYKQTKPNEIAKFMADFAVGDEVNGVTSNVVYDEKKGETLIYVTLGGTLDILCRMMPNVAVVPIKGEKVKVRIIGIDEETLKMWGGIIHVYVKY